MRIRKNIKLTPSIIWSTAASPSTPNPPEELMQAHVCVVNRSPWDVPLPHTGNLYRQPSFSSYQEMEDDDSGSLNDDNSTPQPAADSSRQSVDSMKLSFDHDHKTVVNGCRQESSPIPSSSPAATPTTTKEDNNNDDEAVAAAVAPKRRGRPRKASQATPATGRSNPPEYYYYAGFGPRWGKRRGPDQNVVISRKTVATGNNSRGNDKPSKITNGTPGVTPFTSASQIEYYSNEDDELVADYIEDDDDEDDEVGLERKRVRKPIKARSLKSIIS